LIYVDKIWCANAQKEFAFAVNKGLYSIMDSPKAGAKHELLSNKPTTVSFTRPGLPCHLQAGISVSWLSL
jgi:hypothetical protein